VSELFTIKHLYYTFHNHQLIILVK